jgi:sulfur carrier protein
MPESSAQLTLNGKPVAVPAGSSLADLIAGQREDAQALATALNGSFVPRAQREHIYLQDGDAVTVFKAIVGG